MHALSSQPPLSTSTTSLTHYLGTAGPAAVGHVRVDVELRGLYGLSLEDAGCGVENGRRSNHSNTHVGDHTQPLVCVQVAAV